MSALSLVADSGSTLEGVPWALIAAAAAAVLVAVCLRTLIHDAVRTTGASLARRYHRPRLCAWCGVNPAAGKGPACVLCAAIADADPMPQDVQERTRRVVNAEFERLYGQPAWNPEARGDGS